MNQSPIKMVNPLRIAIFGSIVLAIILLILLGGSYLRQNAAEQLKAEQVILEENLAALQEIDQEQLHELQVELDVIQSEIDNLKRSFPELGSPFAIYHRVMDLAQKSQADLLTITFIDTELKDTVNGTVLIEKYNIEIEGSLTACINFIGEIELEGLDTVTIDTISVLPDDQICSIDMTALGYASNPE